MDLFSPSLASLRDEARFEEECFRQFNLHLKRNKVYRAFVEQLSKEKRNPQRIEDIPMLPIELFKGHEVILDGLESERRFCSSGTTGSNVSTHYVADTDLYRESFFGAFEHFYGNPEEYRILGLLPSYLERNDSSLVFMVNELIKKSKDKLSGTYLDKLDELAQVLSQAEHDTRPTVLIGVSFALLDLAERHPQALRNTIVVETGGMKGKRKEILRSELHHQLKEAFKLDVIHSEYGMTELLSQAWSKGNGWFSCPAWMRVLVRDTSDPFSRPPGIRSGGLDVIDLANRFSCPFIATQDLGKVRRDGTFEVLGRFDHSDVRGCNLMVI